MSFATSTTAGTCPYPDGILLEVVFPSPTKSYFYWASAPTHGIVHVISPFAGRVSVKVINVRFVRDGLHKTVCDAHDTATAKLKEPTKMKIETVTFVNGKDVRMLSVDELLTLVSDSEAEIAKFEKVAHRPKMIDARVVELRDNLRALVSLVDSLP